MKNITVIDAMRKKGKVVLFSPSIYAGSRDEANQFAISPVQINLLPKDSQVGFMVLAFNLDDYHKTRNEIEKEV